MPSYEEFVELIGVTYSHLYDLVHLRTAPLVNLLVPDTTLSSKERAWKLHHLMLEVIDELDPGPKVPAFSKMWRRHRLMVFRYVEGFDPQATADQLAISRRQFYREHADALEAIAEILSKRIEQDELPKSTSELTSMDQHELLRLEATRLAQNSRSDNVGEIISESVEILGELAKSHEIKFVTSLPNKIIYANVNRSVLRQLILGTLSSLVENLRNTIVDVVIEDNQENATIRFSTEHPLSSPIDEFKDRLAELDGLAVVVGASAELSVSDNVGLGVDIVLPVIATATILIVDDNQDVLTLFQRYLASQNYKVITTQSGKEAYDIAHNMHLDVIILDLMMPDHDGWDLLQMLLNHPDTNNIPVIVCSVLKQKELALSLGASMYLKKPIAEKQLVAAIKAVTEM